MNNDRDLRARLEPLMIALADGTLTDEQSAALATALRDNPAAQRYYAHYMFIHASLAWHEAEPVASPASVASPEPRVTTRSKSPLRWASRHPQVPAITVAIAIMLMVLGAMAVMPMKRWIVQREEETPEKRSKVRTEFIAQVTGWHNDVWVDGRRQALKDPRLESGRRLVLKSGFAEITYNTGAVVTLEGPAEYVVGTKSLDAQGAADRKAAKWNVNSGYLKLGRLVARVVGEDAQGFAIDTPTARVEDLGTEFGVEVRADGEAEIVVIDGLVDLIRDKTDPAAEKVRISKGQGAFVAASGQSITLQNTTDLSRFARSTSEAVRKGLVDGLVVYLPFDEGFSDATGRGNDATPIGEAQLVEGAVGNAVNMPTVDDYVSLGKPADMDFGDTEAGTAKDFSIAFWLYQNATNSDSAVFSNKDWGSGSYVGVNYAATGNGLFDLNTKGSVGGRLDLDQAENSASTELGRWSLVVTTFDRDGYTSMWINGKAVGRVETSKGSFNGLNWSIGQDGTGQYPHNFDGKVDEFAVWHRLITQAEVTTLWNRGEGISLLEIMKQTPEKEFVARAQSVDPESSLD